MRIQVHSFADRKIFEEHLVWSKGSLLPFQEQVRSGRASDVTYSVLVRRNLELACETILLGKDDQEAAIHFREAVTYGAGLLELKEAGPGPRIYEMEVRGSERKAEVTALLEKPQPRGPHVMSEIDFSYVLNVTMAFGGREQTLRVGNCPEEKYKSPGLVVPEYVFQGHRAFRAWLRGEEELARREAESALRVAGKAPALSAFLAMMDRDQKGFEEHLEERIKAHKKLFQKSPKDPLGAVCLDGLALCRLAIDRGLRVEEWPYLPVRFLPNLQPAVH